MDWIKKIASTALLLSILLVVNSCSIKIGLAPISSIDYSKVKTISIADFQNRAEYVYAPLATEFNQSLKDLFMRQTRLSLVNSNADRSHWPIRRCSCVTEACRLSANRSAPA